MEKVSVIVPIYNVIEYLDECVSSICNQTYSDIEIILVDDGSNDGSENKCDDWARKDLRVKVIHKTNGGLSSARNAGLDNATGEFVLFVDGDDYIELDLLEKTISVINKKKYDMVCFQHYKLFPNDCREGPKLEFGEHHIIPFENRADFYLNVLLRYRIGWEAWSRLFRRSIIENNKLRFADNKKIFAEDLHFSLCYCLYCCDIYCMKDHLYYYRQRAQSIMGTQLTTFNAGRMNDLAKEFFCQLMDDPEVKDIMDIFPLLYFCIMKSIIERYQNLNKLDTLSIREALIQDIVDFDFFINNIALLRRRKKEIKNLFGKEAYSYILLFEYYANGKYIAYRLKNHIYCKTIGII